MLNIFKPTAEDDSGFSAPIPSLQPGLFLTPQDMRPKRLGSTTKRQFDHQTRDS